MFHSTFTDPHQQWLPLSPRSPQRQDKKLFKNVTTAASATVTLDREQKLQNVEHLQLIDD